MTEEEIEELKIKVKALEDANKAMVKEIDDMSSGGIGILIKITKLKEENEELKKEKCELLGLIQAKDKLIEKMKSCGNCKWCSNQCCIENFENPISHRGCENYSQWELAE